MDVMTKRGVGEVALLFGAQLGKTELLLNAIGYFIDAQPASMLFLMPTLSTAQKFSQKKLAPMIAETPALVGKVKYPRERDSGNTILSKDFLGGSMVIAGSNSPSSLRQISTRIVLMDEIDAYEMSAGAEGDPCQLAIARAANFHDALILRSSTPTIRGASRIEAAYEDSDQRKWMCPCPKEGCGKRQWLKWKQVRWPEGKPEDAVYVCEHCQEELNDTQRVQMVMKGEWQASKPEARAKGYWLNGLNRIMGRKKQFKSYLHEFAHNFLEAKKRGREHLKVWTNTFLAETWEESGERIASDEMIKRCEDYPAKTLPEGVLCLTLGADLQKDRAVLTVLGWGGSASNSAFREEVIFITF